MTIGNFQHVLFEQYFNSFALTAQNAHRGSSWRQLHYLLFSWHEMIYKSAMQ